MQQDASPAPTLEAPARATQERPERVYVVSDQQGFVGAYYSVQAARAAMRDYVLVPYVTQSWRVEPGAALDNVWVVHYRANDAVAYVTNSREAAVRAQQEYGRVGLVWTDDVDCWRHPVGKIQEAAAQRLAAVARAHTMYAAPAAQEELARMEAEDRARVDRLLAPDPDGPLARAIRENERIDILEGVVPIYADEGECDPHSHPSEDGECAPHSRPSEDGECAG